MKRERSPHSINNIAKRNKPDPVVATLVDSLRIHSEQPRVLTQVVLAITTLASKEPSYQIDVGLYGGIETLLSSLENHPVDLELKESVYISLATLVSRCPPNQQLLAQIGGCCIPLKWIQNNLGHPDLMSKAMEMLANLAHSGADFPVNSIPILVGILTEYRAHPSLLAHTCRALASASFHSPNVQELISSNGGSKIIIEALRAHPKDPLVIVNSFAVLVNISTNNMRCILDMKLLNGIDVILNSMRHNLPHSTLIKRGCQLLSNLASSDNELGQEIAKLGGVELLLHILREPTYSVDIRSMTCHALANLAGLASNDLTPNLQHGLYSVLHAISRHLMDIELVSSATRLLGNLTYQRPAIQNAVIDCGGVELLVSVLKQYISNHRMAGHIWYFIIFMNPKSATLANLAYHTKGVQEIMASNGGIELLLTVARMHIGHRSTVSSACHALANLAAAAPLRSIICQKGGVEVLFIVLQSHSMDGDVIGAASRAVANLADHSSKEILESGGPQMLMKLLQQHCGRSDVVAHVSRAVATL